MDKTLISVGIGVLLAVINVIAAIVTAYVAFRKQIGTFTAIVLGGMLIRMMVVLAIIATLLSLSDVQPLPFGLSFFISYSILVLIEIVLVHRIYCRAAERRQRKLYRLALRRAAVQNNGGVRSYA